MNNKAELPLRQYNLTYQDKPFRVLQEDRETWFVAADICMTIISPPTSSLSAAGWKTISSGNWPSPGKNKPGKAKQPSLPLLDGCLVGEEPLPDAQSPEWLGSTATPGNPDFPGHSKKYFTPAGVNLTNRISGDIRRNGGIIVENLH